MRRVKKHKVKQEQPEASSSLRDDVERDLTYHIHDRVELMHQVFSVLKPKEIKAMAPQSVQYISLSDLQELCTEELLGISSKRLCAILDGADPPSDTESSSTSTSPEKLETISLDSISSDEEILSEGSTKKKKHKHRRHACKSKAKHKQNSSSENSEGENDRSKASRAGLTVLELLELQARARAIRAQLQQEQAVADVTDLTGAPIEDQASDDEVEIKEEPAEVVEISSDDEKPKLEDLQKEIELSSKNSNVSSNPETHTVTKRINDLMITVPQTKPTRKIKLNRNKVPSLIQNSNDKNAGNTNKTNIMQPDNENVAKEKEKETISKAVDDKNETPNIQEEVNTEKLGISKNKPQKGKQKKKQKKKGKEKSSNKEGSDHDEITLELSDSEKMDLLEDLDRKNLDNVSSSCTEDSGSSSDSEGEIEKVRNKSTAKNVETPKSKTEIDAAISNENEKDINTGTECDLTHRVEEKTENEEIIVKDIIEVNSDEQQNVEDIQIDKSIEDKNKIIEVTTLDDIPIRNDNSSLQEVSETLQNCSIDEKSCDESTDDRILTKDDGDKSESNTKSNRIQKVTNKDLSEGELSDRESSEVEASDVKPEVVCISDDEIGDKRSHKKKKKNKKKEKKSKKDKRSKKSPDFRKNSDQNFFEESGAKENLTEPQSKNPTETISLEDDDVYEILELSSDSSCNEDGGTVLSKEPTAEEIEALSAKIDEIEREDVVTEEQIREHERLEAQKSTEVDPENISWKDRYLDSKKVKTVLTTSNIFNAMRKKNKELKRKLEEAKKEVALVPSEVKVNSNANLEEGSIEHYNTLEGSTKYVDPIREENEKEVEKEADTSTDKETAEGQVTREMKKDAKQLLKMYKKLLKYNDMNRQTNPNKRKKKKQKKNKEDKSRTETNTESKIVS